MQITDREFLDVTTPSCHAGTLCFYKDVPIYAWFGGTIEGSPDSSIYIQCKDKIHIIGDKDQLPRWNPILFAYKDELYLFVKVGIFCDRWCTQIYKISNILDDSFDINKLECQILSAGLNGPVKTKIIVNKGPVSNLIHCGSSVENILDWTSYIESYMIKDGQFIFRDRSKPLTVPKKIYNDPYYGKRQTMGIIQPALFFNGKELSAFFRSSRGLGKIYYSSSYKNDLGSLVWPDPVETKFDNPNSGIDVVNIKDRIFLVHNPSAISRSPLVISELDKGFNVIDEIVVREKVEGITKSPELSYPYLIENDNKLHLVYTHGRSKIENVTIEI